MPFEAQTLLSSIPCTEFIQSYPYPAIVLSKRLFKRHAGELATALAPMFANQPWKDLIYGSHGVQQVAQSGALLESLGGGLRGIEEASKLGDWVENVFEGGKEPYLLTVEPKWHTEGHGPVQLELIKTSLHDFWMVISIPRTQLPIYRTSPVASSSNSSGIHREASASLRLTDLPLRTTDPQDIPSLYPCLTATDDSIPLVPNCPLEHPVPEDSEIRRLLAEFPWHTSPLGPRDQWPQSLKSALGYIVASPFPMALFWGPELTLLYNDQYKEQVAGNKHPAAFGQFGSVAWGEVWDELGPLTKTVLGGQSVAKQDDLLFFDRLTENKFPEEVYHTWQYVPVPQEDGTVGGFINSTIETTDKVIAARRLRMLRDLGDKSVLAQNKQAYADAVINSLEKNPLDIPFALLYFSTAEASPVHPTSPGNPSDANTTKPQNIRVSLQLAASIGIPDSHPETPEKMEVFLHPVTQHRIWETDPASRDPNTPQTTTTSVEDAPTSQVDKSPSNTSDITVSAWKLKAEGHAVAVPQWPLFDAFGSQAVALVKELPDSIADSLVRRGWGDRPRQAVTIQIAAEGDLIPSAILILGVNTRRPYDKDYQTCIDVLRLTIGSILTAVTAREAEKLKAEQLCQLDAAKTTFFSSASHELRTPLTLIAGPITDLIAQTQDSHIKERLKLVSRNVARLSRLVDGLMEFTRLEAGRLKGRFRPLQLDSFTSDLANLFRVIIEKNKIEFTLEVNLDEDRAVYVDPDFWEKIVFNLIGNAFKYTLAGSIKVQIRYDSANCYLVVSDTGAGVPEEDLEKIFERFHRVSSISRSHEGTGIGLSLTRELVRLQGGDISVESRLMDQAHPNAHHGTIFTVSIPLGRDHLCKELIDDTESDFTQNSYARSIVEEASYWSVSRTADESTPSESSESATSSEGSRNEALLFQFMKKDVIMIVDDNIDIRTYIRSIFSRLCTVIEASNGKEALNMIQQGARPDLILSDVMMPIMDGYGLLTAIREQAATQLIPVILLTAKAGEESRMEGLLSGADDYISKPFRSRELVARAHLQIQLGKRKIEMQQLFDQRTQEIQVLSDMSPVGIFRVDTGGRATYSNSRWHQITGQPGICPLNSWAHNVHPEDRKETTRLWDACLDLNQGGSMDMRWANGTWTKMQIQPLSNGLIATITDISDRRLYEAAQLAQAQERVLIAKQRALDAEERQREADSRRRSQELLVDVTSHEMRQPVSAILNCSALVRGNLGRLQQDLQESFDNRTAFVANQDLLDVIGEDLEALDAIYQCGLAQERIANDILSLSRIQLEVLSIHPSDFNLAQELRRILSLFANELKMKAIELSIVIGDSLEKYGVERVRADKGRFAQVITNLMSNAIKFTDTSPPSRRTIHVCLEVSDRGPVEDKCIAPPEDNTVGTVTSIPPGASVHTFLSVTDSGPGLKPSDLALLFQRFQQGSNSHEVFGGSGLGLFVSRKLCDLMGGSIDVDSVLGEGATFRFYINAQAAKPLSPSESQQEQLRSHPRPLPSPPTPKKTPRKDPGPVGVRRLPSQTSYRILITEDNLINQTVLNRQLKKAGFATAVANNGEEALQQIKMLGSGPPAEDGSLSRFDVILMDCEMPVMDGLTAVREIRRMEALGELPYRNQIIALTANARSGQVASAREAGIDDIVIKPYKLDELLIKIRQWASYEGP